MYVCLCKGITDSEIRRAAQDGASSFGQVRKRLGVASQCGKCSCLAKEILKDAIHEKSLADNSIFYQLA